jgi:GH18 family chitinase
VPYLSCAGFYITYDDAESVRYKQEYVNTMKLGGIFFWALGQDNGAIISQIVAPASVTPVVTAAIPVSTTITPTAKKSKTSPSTLSTMKTTTTRTIRTLRKKVPTKR